ncbi:hypothetical protein D3C79_823250 [compost metagenome]
MPGARAYRAQDGHFPAPFIEAGEDRGEHADQAGQYHKQRDHEQCLLSRAHQAPELLQGYTGEDRQQRFAAVLVDFPLQAEGCHLVVQAEHERGDGYGLEVHVARLLGADAPSAAGWHAVVPVDVDGFHPAQADV